MTLGLDALAYQTGGIFNGDEDCAPELLGVHTWGIFTDSYEAIEMDPVEGCAGDAVTLAPAAGAPGFGTTEGVASYAGQSMEILAWDDQAVVARIPLQGFSGRKVIVATADALWRTTERWYTFPTLFKEDGSDVIRLQHYKDLNTSILPPIPQSSTRAVDGVHTRQRGRATILGKPITLQAVYLDKQGQDAAKLWAALNAGGEWVLNEGRSWYRVKFASAGVWRTLPQSGVAGGFPVQLAFVVTSETYDSATGWYFTGRAPVGA